MIFVARTVMGLSGALLAALALLPPLVAGLILLFDAVAHALFGASNAMLDAAGTSDLPGRELLRYQGIAIPPALVVLLTAARGLPPLAMLLVALRPALLRGLARRIVFDVLVVLAWIGQGIPGMVLLLPGVLAALALQVAVRQTAPGHQIM